MSEKLYWFDKETLTFKPVKKGSVLSLKFALIGFGAGAVIIGMALTVIALFVYQTPQEVLLKEQLTENRKRLARFNRQLNTARNSLEKLRQRDELLYQRMLKKDLQASLPSSGNFTGKRKMDRRNMHAYTTATSGRLKELRNAIEKQHRMISLLQISYDKQKEQLAHTPSIIPVNRSLLKYPPHGFGRRIDPVYGTPAFHEGIDFTARRGTPIYATANGVVESAGYATGGYGIKVIIDHKYGYKTLYAHLSEALVKKGQQISRGQKIGLVGNTGKSVAAHLHYEVHKNKKVINPIHYFYNDLGPKAFRKLIVNVNKSNVSLD